MMSQTPQLDYAPQPAVGDVTLTRSGGVTVVTRQPSWRRMAAAALPGLSLIGLVGCVISFALCHHDISATQAYVTVALATLVAVGACAPGMVLACHPIRWAVTADGVEVTARRASQVAHGLWPRAGIADLRVGVYRPANGLLPRPMLVAVGPRGDAMGIAVGKRPEMEFMAGAFRDALGIGADPLGESALPPPPTMCSPVSRRVGMDNVSVTLHAPRPGADAGMSATILLAAGVAAALADRTAGKAPLAAAMAVCGATMLAGSLFVAAALLIVYRLRRKVIVEVSPAGVTLSEQTLISPARQVWSLDRVQEFRIHAHGKRSDLVLTLFDGSTARLVRRGPRAHAAYMRDVLAAALARLDAQPAALSAAEPPA